MSRYINISEEYYGSEGVLFNNVYLIIKNITCIKVRLPLLINLFLVGHSMLTKTKSFEKRQLHFHSVWKKEKG
jgi:hypothetical protein